MSAVSVRHAFGISVSNASLYSLLTTLQGLNKMDPIPEDEEKNV